MTILYQSDFAKYPNAIIDLKTRNRTWVDFAGKLNAMGVKNWGFHLTLLDPGLQGVDPYDPDLDITTILRIQRELKNNWWYYLREVFMVPSKTGVGRGYLEANRGNIACFWSVFNHFVTYMEQIRQTGKSLTGRALKTGFHTAWSLGSEGSTISSILFTKSDLRPDEIKEYKAIKSQLPPYMYYHTMKDKDNQQDFTTLSRNVVTYSYIPAGSADDANKVGRGKTPLFILGDEVPFLSYCDISIPSLIASTNRSFTDAKKVGAFHAILYTTTAGDLSTREGKYVYEKIRQVGMFFSEALYDCKDVEDARAMIFSNSTNKIVPHLKIAFNHLQLGFTNEWLHEKIATVPASKDQIKRDYLGIWTFGSQENPIDETILNIIRKYSNEGFVSKRYMGSYTVRFHQPPEYVVTRKVVMGLDTSEAIGRDMTTGVLVDVETLETLAAFGIADSNLFNVGTFLVHFMKAFPNVTMVPEAKSSWNGGLRDQLIIEFPKHGMDIGKRVYSTIVDDAKGDEQERRLYREYSAGFASEYKYNNYRQEFGFKTSKASRDVLYRDVMMNVTKEVPKLVRDPVLIDELSTLVERKGRIDHALSGHDDHVISWLLAHWLIRYGRNLEHYGIDAGRVMRNVVIDREESPSELKKRQKYFKIKEQIDAALNRLEVTKSVVEIAYLESRISMLERELPDVSGFIQTPSSLSASSMEAKQKRKERSRHGHHDPVFTRPLF